MDESKVRRQPFESFKRRDVVAHYGCLTMIINQLSSYMILAYKKTLAQSLNQQVLCARAVRRSHEQDISKNRIEELQSKSLSRTRLSFTIVGRVYPRSSVFLIESRFESSHGMARAAARAHRMHELNR
jgi:hypothetical protein